MDVTTAVDVALWLCGTEAEQCVRRSVLRWNEAAKVSSFSHFFFYSGVFYFSFRPCFLFGGFLFGSFRFSLFFFFWLPGGGEIMLRWRGREEDDGALAWRMLVEGGGMEG